MRGGQKEMAGKKSNLPKVDRLKELEKIAEQLGIGQNREVKCVGCKTKILFKKAVTLTNKKKVTYLCKDCYKKLEKGELDSKQIDDNDILKELEKIKKLPPTPDDIKTVPWKPDQSIPWQPYKEEWIPEKYNRDTAGSDLQQEVTKYEVSSMKALSSQILKIESSHGD